MGSAGGNPGSEQTIAGPAAASHPRADEASRVTDGGPACAAGSTADGAESASAPPPWRETIFDFFFDFDFFLRIYFLSSAGSPPPSPLRLCPPALIFFLLFAPRICLFFFLHPLAAPHCPWPHGLCCLASPRHQLLSPSARPFSRDDTICIAPH